MAIKHNMNTVSENLLKIMGIRGLSRTGVADLTEVSNATVCRIINRKSPSPRIFNKLIEGLRIEESDLTKRSGALDDAVVIDHLIMKTNPQLTLDTTPDLISKFRPWDGDLKNLRDTLELQESIIKDRNLEIKELKEKLLGKPTTIAGDKDWLTVMEYCGKRKVVLDHGGYVSLGKVAASIAREKGILSPGKKVEYGNTVNTLPVEVHAEALSQYFALTD